MERGVFLRPLVPVLVAGVAVHDLHAVQVTGDGGGALLPVGVGLDQQGPRLPGQGREGGDPHAEQLLRTGQQLVGVVVQQIVVAALVKAQLRPLVNLQPQGGAGRLHPPEALQEGVRHSRAGGGGVHMQVGEGVPVIVVGNGQAGVARPGAALRQDGGQPAAGADVAGVQVRLNFKHSGPSLVT